MNKTMVSIIVPCYNQAEYLSDCLESVLKQSYNNWECIVVNDGSDDSTEKIAKQWMKIDSRFKYVYQENAGLSSARNLGISSTLGELILPLDSDDKIAVMYVELAVEAFKKNDCLKVVYCNAEKFGEVNEKWLLPEFSLENLSKSNIIFCSAFFKRSDWIAVGGYDEKMIYGWEDWEFWISLLKNGGEVTQLKYIGFFYRIKSTSMLLSIKGEKIDYLRNYLSTKHADFFVKYYGSFMKLKEELFYVEFECAEKLRSKTFVLNLFFKLFFKFNLFTKYKNE